MGRIIKLPEPEIYGTMTLEMAIAQRRSCRDYLPDALTLEQTGQLCWAAQGQVGRYRTVPSAGAIYPLEVFVVSGDGFFHYLQKEHSLEELSTEDLRGKLTAAAGEQGFIAKAAVTIVLACEFARTMGRYGERGVYYIYLEAGHAAQNVHLQAEALELGSVSVGAFDDEAVSKVLSLPDNLKPLYMVVAGRRRKIVDGNLRWGQ